MEIIVLYEIQNDETPLTVTLLKTGLKKRTVASQKFIERTVN